MKHIASIQGGADGNLKKLIEIVLQNVELQNVELQNAELQNVEKTKCRITKRRLQNVESYKW
jgi:hypothetical protein